MSEGYTIRQAKVEAWRLLGDLFMPCGIFVIPVGEKNIAIVDAVRARCGRVK